MNDAAAIGTRAPRAGTKAARLFAALADGPGTAVELAAEFGWTAHDTTAHLRGLLRRGAVTRRRFKSCGARDIWMWEIAR